MSSRLALIVLPQICKALDIPLVEIAKRFEKGLTY